MLISDHPSFQEEPREVIEWLKQNPKWFFNGKVNKFSHERVLSLVNALYKAGSPDIVISCYLWEMEPMEMDSGEALKPDMLIITLPKETKKREAIFEIVNNSYSQLTAWLSYKEFESRTTRTIWYFFEPEPQKITVVNKEISWYS